MNIQDIVKIIQSKHTDPLRRAILIAELIENHRIPKKKIARLLKKSPSYISNHLILLRLPDAVKDALISGIISEGHGRALSTLGTTREVLEVFEDIVRYGHSVRDTERIVDKKRSTKRAYGRLSPEFKELEKKLRQKTSIETTILRRKNYLHLTLSVPYSIVGFRIMRKILNRLLED